jgi:hypothetical protein
MLFCKQRCRPKVPTRRHHLHWRFHLGNFLKIRIRLLFRTDEAVVVLVSPGFPGSHGGHVGSIHSRARRQANMAACQYTVMLSGWLHGNGRRPRPRRSQSGCVMAAPSPPPRRMQPGPRTRRSGDAYRRYGRSRPRRSGARGKLEHSCTVMSCRSTCSVRQSA